MQAIVIPQPWANDLVLGKLTEINLAVTTQASEILLVSGNEEVSGEYALGLAKGYALGILRVKSITPTATGFEWVLDSPRLVAPFAVATDADLLEVDEALIHENFPATVELEDWMAHPGEAFPPALQTHADALLAIGTQQLPSDYQAILTATNGDWEAVDAAWYEHEYAEQAAILSSLSDEEFAALQAQTDADEWAELVAARALLLKGMEDEQGND